MNLQAFLSFMGGMYLGAGVVAIAHEIRNQQRRRQKARQNSLLEDDLYPYYPTPKSLKEEVKHEQVRGF